MSTAGTIDLPLEIFSGYVPEIAPSDLPSGASHDCNDVQFPLGSWKTRGGLGTGVFPANGARNYNYLKTFIDQQLNKRFLFLDSLGNISQEFPYGTVTTGINTISIPANSYAKSATAYGKEYIAASDGQFGIADPAHWDGTYYDRTSQVGPGAAPSGVADISYTITAISRTSGLITLTIAVPLATSGLTVGSFINIVGVNADPTFNGQYPIVSLAGTTSTTITAWGNPGTYTVNSMVRAGNVVTAVLQQTPTFANGATIIIGFSADSTFDGEFTISSITGNVVTWAQTAGNASTLTAVLYTSSSASPIPLLSAQNNWALQNTSKIGFTFFVGPNVDISGIGVGTTVIIAGTTISGYNMTVTITDTITYADGNVGFEAAPLAASGTSIATGGTMTASIPDSAPAVTGIAGPAGNIPQGEHQISLFFITRSLFYTKPAPAMTWNAAGGFKAAITGIAVGPANIIQRVLIFTEAGGATFYYTTGSSSSLPNGNMVINDNTTTTATVDFSDTILAAGSNAQYLFNLLDLEECAGVTSYATRLFWWGGRNRVPNFNNFSFDGGWNLGGGLAASDVPLGWTSDPVFGAGGARLVGSPVWDDAYSITGNGALLRGMITQPAYQDWLGNPIILPNTPYSVRLKIFGPAVHAGGVQITVDLYSPTKGVLGSALLSPSSLGPGPVEFINTLMMSQAVIPSDLVIRLYASNTLPNGVTVSMDNLQTFPTNQPYLNGTVRASYAGQPESYDQLSGVLQPNFQDGGTIRNCFVLREKLYMLKDNTWFVTQDDGQNEPSAWTITVVSLAVGACGVNAADLGEDWGIVANRAGPYLFWGAEPIKVGQEIQSDSSFSGKPTWSSINWQYGYTIWVLLDRVRKRALIGAPINGATTPNCVFYFDYVGLDTVQEVADHWSVKYSSYTGKILAIGNAPKWAPWSICANSAALIERSDGTTHTFIGNGPAGPYLGNGPSSSGKIYDLLDTNLNDDGAGIPWSYSTYYTPSHMEEQALQIKSHRKLYAYLAGFVRGSGLMGISAQPMGNITPTTYQPYQLVDPDAQNAITGISRQNGVTTFTCAGGHGLFPNDQQVVIQDALDPSFNGTLPIQQILNSQQFTVGQYTLSDLLVGAGGTVNRLSREFEYTTNILGERVSYTFSNSGGAANCWAQCEKIIFSIVPDPWAPVRGTMY